MMRVEPDASRLDQYIRIPPFLMGVELGQSKDSTILKYGSPKSTMQVGDYEVLRYLIVHNPPAQQWWQFDFYYKDDSLIDVKFEDKYGQKSTALEHQAAMQR